jgi:extracellular factor (EF) 3-hydroxypalmitic acid methyl ester biosynthesis protein
MPLAPEFEHHECCAQWRHSDGRDRVFPLLHLDLHAIAFECPDPSLDLRTSQRLPDFQVVAHGRQLFRGRAVISELIATSHSLLVQVRVEDGWEPLPELSPSTLCTAFDHWLHNWRRHLHLDPACKEAVLDLHTFLQELRSWCAQIELETRTGPGQNAACAGTKLCALLAPKVEPQLRGLFDRFEVATQRLDPHRRPAHAAFARRLLHPLLLCSPFVSRTYGKPLGHAGDYEMVNMMFREPCHGESLLARTINYYALQLPPIQAHRNRIQYLADLLEREALRQSSAGKSLRYLSIGCGPAQEVQQFARRSTLAADVQFTLIDFERAAVQHVREVLSSIPTVNARPLRFHVSRQSLKQFLRLQSRPPLAAQPDSGYDLICCAGLFDYLADPVCRLATETLATLLRPGGCLLVTNVDQNPCRFQMEAFLDWHVVPRSRRELLALLPPTIPTDTVDCRSELTGVNLLMEIRQPQGALARGTTPRTRPG